MINTLLLILLVSGFPGLSSAPAGATFTAYESRQNEDWIILLLDILGYDIPEEELEEILHTLRMRREQPVSIRDITSEYLRELLFLDEFEIQQIMHWRNSWVNSDSGGLPTYADFLISDVIDVQMSELLYHFVQFGESGRGVGRGQGLEGDSFRDRDDGVERGRDDDYGRDEREREREGDSGRDERGRDRERERERERIEREREREGVELGREQERDSSRELSSEHEEGVRQKRLANVNRIPVQTDFRVNSVYPTATGYNNHYRGNPIRYQERIWIINDQYSAHLSRSKQSGESMNYPQITGFQTFHVGAQVRPWISVIVGDYSVQYGSGLILNRGTMQRKTRNLQRIGAARATVRPYRSGSPGNFMRGSAVQVQTGNVNSIAFFSKRKLSASGEQIDDREAYFMPGWWMSRRTETEIGRYQNLGLNTAGIISTIQGEIGKLRYGAGVSGLGNWFDSPIIKRNAWHNRHDFEGDRLMQWSVTTELNYESVQYMVEVSGADVGGKALVQGMRVVGQQVDVGLWHRDYALDYYSIYGGGPGAFSGIGNEVGLGSWLVWRVRRGVRVRLYADRYESRGARFGSDVGVSGLERGVAVDFRRGRGLLLRGEYMVRSDLSGSVVVDDFGRDQRMRLGRDRGIFRGSVRVEPGAGWMWQMRVEVQSWWGEQLSQADDEFRGMGVTQVVRYSRGRFELIGQYTLFDTDNYDTRVYSYEYDLLNQVRIPSFSGKGQRMYILGQIRAGERFLFRGKIGRTEYTDRFAIGSGHDQTNGNYRIDYGLQMQIRL